MTAGEPSSMLRYHALASPGISFEGTTVVTDGADQTLNRLRIGLEMAALGRLAEVFTQGIVPNSEMMQDIRLHEFERPLRRGASMATARVALQTMTGNNEQPLFTGYAALRTVHDNGSRSTSSEFKMSLEDGALLHVEATMANYARLGSLPFKIAESNELLPVIKAARTFMARVTS